VSDLKTGSEGAPDVLLRCVSTDTVGQRYLRAYSTEGVLDPIEKVYMSIDDI
jgi:hypothetical protein